MIKLLVKTLNEARKSDPDFKEKMQLVKKMSLDPKAVYYLNSWLYLGRGKNFIKYSDRIDQIRGIKK